MSDSIGFLVIMGIAIVIYFAPTFIAVERRHHQMWAIVATNIIFGWTFIGWGLAMIWAVSAKR
ncbi:superinfection immunity protein [Skermanella stibiiresistens]|uniref:superinfection immunity protein n=1 Tax=Skermanella stibiiresistens TaxID=913326 RepID=UPI0004ACD4B7|nr:superinfection immunity protein [Skermanella stibiiresistens]